MSVISGMHRLRIDFYVCHWTMGKDERKMFCASHEGNVKISSKFLYHLNPYCSRPASYKTSDIGFGSLSETPVTVSLYNRRRVPFGIRVASAVEETNFFLKKVRSMECTYSADADINTSRPFCCRSDVLRTILSILGKDRGKAHGL